MVSGTAKPKMSRGLFVVSLAAFAIVAGVASHSLSFVSGARALSSAPKALATSVTTAEATPEIISEAGTLRASVQGFAAAACLAGLTVAATRQRLCVQRSSAATASLRGRATRVQRLIADNTSTVSSAMQPLDIETAKSNGDSPWHTMTLFAKTSMGVETDVLQYVCNMTKDSFQKFKLMPNLPGNPIEEDLEVSSHLAAAGLPAPFNYGCLPQTYSDPEASCKVHGAPGSDSPLAVIDLCGSAAAVGEAVRCRPLGAVCVTDDHGRAAWKILAVNIDATGPLALCASITEVESVAPGRVRECLQWFDDFCAGAEGAAQLHFQVHDAKVAKALVQEDHAAWRKLMQEAGPCGMARGHWIRSPQLEVQPRVEAELQQQGWGALVHFLAAPSKQLQQAHALLAGATRAPVLARASERSSAAAAEVSAEPAV